MSDTPKQPIPTIAAKPVIVANPEPLAVVVAEPLPVPAAPEDPPAQATTTSEQQVHSKSQRRVNLIWEVVQAMLALVIVNSALYVAIKLVNAALYPEASKEVQALAITAFLLLSNLASLVIGFYFGRTNHQNVGGVQLGR